MKLHPAHSDLGLNLHKSSRVSIRVNVIGRNNFENYRVLSDVWSLGHCALCFSSSLVCTQKLSCYTASDLGWFLYFFPPATHSALYIVGV